MRRRIDPSVLVTTLPKEPRKIIKCKPFNRWFREEVLDYHRFKASDIALMLGKSKHTVRCWKYRTSPQPNNRYQLARLISGLRRQPYKETLFKIERLIEQGRE